MKNKNNHSKKNQCNLCIYNCRLLLNDIGMCGVITNRPHSLRPVYPKKINFIKNSFIETLHFYHFWPGHRINALIFHRDNSKRFSFIEFNAIEVTNKEALASLILSLLEDKNSIGLYIGGLEPLIYLSQHKDLMRTIVEHKLMYKRRLLTETFFLIDAKPLTDILPAFEAVSLNILISKNCKYDLIPCPDRKVVKELIHLLNKFKTHYEININLLDESVLTSEVEEELINILEPFEANTPIHIIRLRSYLGKKILITTRTLERVRKILKSIGFNYVYIDELYLSAKNKTPLNASGSIYLERFGPWLKIKRKEIKVGSNVIKGMIKETYPQFFT